MQIQPKMQIRTPSEVDRVYFSYDLEKIKRFIQTADELSVERFFYLAVRYGYIDLLKYMIENKYDIDKPFSILEHIIFDSMVRSSPIRLSIYMKNDNVQKILVQNNVKIDDRDYKYARSQHCSDELKKYLNTISFNNFQTFVLAGLINSFCLDALRIVKKYC